MEAKAIRHLVRNVLIEKRNVKKGKIAFQQEVRSAITFASKPDGRRGVTKNTATGLESNEYSGRDSK